MKPNKDHIAQLAASATAALRTHQIDTSQPEPPDDQTLAPVIATIMAETGCVRRTAKKYADQAVAAARGTPISPTPWGGRRGGGRPRRGTTTHRKDIAFSDDVFAAIEAYRATHQSTPSFTAAVDTLLASHPDLQKHLKNHRIS